MAARPLSTVGALSVVLALSLSGCSLTAEPTTNRVYSPSDGIGGVVEGVRVQNLLLITSGAGEDAVLIGSLYNDTSTPVEVALSVETETASFTIPAMSTVKLGLDEGDETLIVTTTVAPGLKSKVQIAVDKIGATTKPLPVLDGTLPEYAGIVDALEAKSS